MTTTTISYDREITVEFPSTLKYVWKETSSDDFLTNVSVEHSLEKRRQSVLHFAYAHLQNRLFEGFNELRDFMAETSPQSCVWLCAGEEKALMESMSTEAYGLGKIAYDKNGQVITDTSKTKKYRVPATESIERYMERVVFLEQPLAWVNEMLTRPLVPLSITSALAA